MFHTMMWVSWVVFHAYVLFRASSVPAISRRIPPLAIALTGAGLCAAYLPLRALEGASSRWLAMTAEWIGMTWLTALFLTAVALLVADLLTAFGFLFRPRAGRIRGYALLAGLLLTALALVQGMRPPVVRSFEVSLPGLPAERDGTVVVALSDLHIGTLLGERWLAARVTQVLAQQPDLILLLGDIFEGHGDPGGDLLPALRRLTAPLGVLAVAGNHEFHGSREGNLDLLTDAGIRVLRDTRVDICPGLTVAGVDAPSRRNGPAGSVAAIPRALDGRPPGAVILLSHVPCNTQQAVAEDVALMLSGHTHGGQVWPFGTIVRTRHPLLAGRYTVDGMTVIVCRGTGTWGPRMRLWHPGEILRITLRSPA